jgi:hypothetical protein
VIFARTHWTTQALPLGAGEGQLDLLDVVEARPDVVAFVAGESLHRGDQVCDALAPSFAHGDPEVLLAVLVGVLLGAPGRVDDEDQPARPPAP